LDPADNALSVPGTLAVAPMAASAMNVEPGLPPTTPLVMWYGSMSLENTDLFNTQVQAMSQKTDRRMEGGSDSAWTSGIIVNTNGWIQDVSKYDIVMSEGMQL
jgi:mRNA cleavage and polyadenylation factor CLP1 P-loop